MNESNIFLGRENTVKLTHKTDNVDTDFTGADKLVLVLLADDATENQTIESTSADSKIDFTTAGVLIFKLGGEGIPAGRYNIELVSVTGAAETQLIHRIDNFYFSFLAAAAIS